MSYHFFGAPSRDWRPVFIRTERDVKRLNRLFASGWHLIDLGHRDLPLFAFHVPSSELRPLPGAGAGSEPGSDTGHTLLLILRRGHGDSVQRAAMIPRNAEGYADLASVSVKLYDEREGPGSGEKVGPAVTRTLSMENGQMLAIISWKRGGR
jgi:hypothetical protein